MQRHRSSLDETSLTIETGVKPYASTSLVERKGWGHPDTLADNLAEELSKVYSRYTLAEFGSILHHNFDKLAILGGASEVRYGSGAMTKPVRVLVNGRITRACGDQQIPVDDLIVDTVLAFFQNRLPELDGWLNLVRWVMIGHDRRVSTVDRSREDLAVLAVGLAAALERANARIAELEAEVATLRSGTGKDSRNSSAPPSRDSIAAKAERKAALSQRVRSKDRKPGGQKGRAGSGLEPTRDPDRTERRAAPAACSGCGCGLTDSSDAGQAWAQVWDIPVIEVEKVHYLLPRRRCGCGKRTTTALAPFALPGTVVYGPNVNAAAILLSSQGNVPLEATAALMAALLGAPVSTGFVAHAHARFAGRLADAGFDAAMEAALTGEDVLCADETPVNVVKKDTDAEGEPVPGSPQVITVRTPDERLVWYRATPARSKGAIKDLGVFDTWRGYLVRDDYAGWYQFDAQLAGVQQCVAHLFRYVQGVLDLNPDHQAWAGDVRQVLREAHTAVQVAISRGEDHLDPDLLAGLRARYDKAVHWGQITNRHRDWPSKGNHPGYNLARRLAAKADQVWLFTTVFAVPWTNNASEQALKSPKSHQKVSGYWHTPTTLARYCRVRSYLVSARNHGVRAIDAIHTALLGDPWLPAST